MTDSPHDALFKAAFETPSHATGVFRGVLPRALVDSIAWSSITLQPGSFIDPELAGRHSDLLFAATFRNRPVLLYLLLEHQSRSDPDMPLRMLVYLVRIWERFRKNPAHDGDGLPVIIPVVVSHALGGWRAPRSFHALFDPVPCDVPGLDPLVPDFSIVVEDLATLSNEDIRGLTLDAFPSLVLWSLRDARNIWELLRNLETWVDALSAMLLSPSGLAQLVQLLRYMRLVLAPVDLARFRAKIRKTIPGVEAAMTLEELVRKQERSEGRTEGRAELLLEQLAIKFGTVSERHRERVAKATTEDLRRYAARILVADTIDAVFE